MLHIHNISIFSLFPIFFPFLNLFPTLSVSSPCYFGFCLTGVGNIEDGTLAGIVAVRGM